MSEKIKKSENEWKENLSPEQFSVCRQKGTERAFTGKYHDCKDPGVYACACCGQALFSSDTKYDSGSGWPSFWAPLSKEAVSTVNDNSHFMQRTEVLCSRCDAHLGHVFDDGPAPTNKRFCINSLSLNLEKKEEK